MLSKCAKPRALLCAVAEVPPMGRGFLAPSAGVLPFAQTLRKSSSSRLSSPGCRNRAWLCFQWPGFDTHRGWAWFKNKSPIAAVDWGPLSYASAPSAPKVPFPMTKQSPHPQGKGTPQMHVHHSSMAQYLRWGPGYPESVIDSHMAKDTPTIAISSLNDQKWCSIAPSPPLVVNGN